MQLYRLAQARDTGHITREEYEQYTDYHTGLNLLDSQTDNLITHRLWAWLKLPLGFIQCTDGQWRHISTIARYGKRNPKGKSITLAIVNRLIKDALNSLLVVQEATAREPFTPNDLPIIDEHTDKAVTRLLTANVMIEEEK